MTSGRLDLWRRWAVAILGGLLAALNIAASAVDPEPPSAHAVQLIVPVLLALGLAAFGVRLARQKPGTIETTPIITWSLAGALALALFGAWEMVIHLLEGETLRQAIHEVSQGGTIGAGAGALVGLYDSRRRDEHREAERAQQAISASMDGMAILDENGEYESVNEAHADVYGYDDPDVFVGETWHMCYSEEEAARVEAEILPRLDEVESWRGELTGRRRDGSTFPQELTLSARPDGGFVCIVRDISERKEYENKLGALHGVTREFLNAETPQEIAAEMVSVAHETLGYPLTAVWEYDADADRLVPLSVTGPARRFAEKAGLEEFPALEPGTAEMEIFREGEAVLIDDYRTLENRQVAQPSSRAVLFVPLDDYGLLAVGGPELEGLDATDRFLVEILASNARAALDRLEREWDLAAREQRLRTILENAPVVLFAIDQDRELTLQVGKGLDRVGVEQNQEVGTTVDELFGDSPVFIDAVDRSLDGEPVAVTIDISGRTHQVWFDPIADGGAVRRVIGVAMDITERHERERGIRMLHDATREMVQETDPEWICRTAVDAAQNALDLPMSAIWLRADDRPRLDPVAWSDAAEELLGELPTFEPGNSISWQVYAESEPRVFDDVGTAADRVNPDTEIRGELIVPIGEYGVLNSGSTDVGQFDETDVALTRLLAANTRSALDRAEREKDLQRQTDRMEFFNSILRHDVLNGMTVIRGRAELLAEELDGEQLRDAETIVDWSDDVVRIIQRVRAVLETLTGEGEPQLDAVDLSAALRSEVDRVRGTYPEVEFEADVPDGVSVRANDLLAEVLGNVITNAVEHNDTDGLCVSVAVDDASDDETVTVRIADNGHGIPDEHKEAIFRRDETGHVKSTGSGFGLFFVDSMVAEYGGDIRVEDNEPQGAAFVIELPAPSP